MEIYLVGGAVRDQLLGYPVKERDYVVVGATPEQMLAQGFQLVGKDFPVFLHPKTHEEYALARTERKIGPGYKGFACYAAPNVTLEEDLQRRDLTINAMAQTREGGIIDPYQGRKDITDKWLRHVSPAFSEDPVRILRVARFMARFAALGFRVAFETMELMKAMVQAGEVEALVPERVWQELSSALTEPVPQAFIKTLYDCGALTVLFPMSQALVVECNRVTDKRHDDRPHCLAILEQAVKLTSNPKVRFAAILCDLSKGLSPDHQPINEAGIRRLQALCQRYRVPHTFASLALIAVRYHLLCHRALACDPQALLALLEKTDAFRQFQRFQQFLLVCEADFLSYPGGGTKPYLQKERVLSALTVAKAVAIEPLIKKGLTGENLGKKLREQRIEAISQLICSD